MNKELSDKWIKFFLACYIIPVLYASGVTIYGCNYSTYKKVINGYTWNTTEYCGVSNE